MGRLSSLQHFSTNDGYGIRSVLFFKGCPLNCVWCHNPESKSSEIEFSYDEKQCIGCRRCAEVCENSCHLFKDGRHIFERTSCKKCGRCAEVCPGAIKAFGEEISAEKAAELLLKDKPFFDVSGGITLSGGEVLFQPEFAVEILKICKLRGVNTCVETSCFGCFSDIRAISRYTDLFLCDFKLTDDNLHKKYTGVSNSLIIENIKKLDKMGAKIILRCPIIPGVNDNTAHFEGVTKLADSLQNIQKIQILPYHNIYISKCKAFGYVPHVFPVADKETTKRQIDFIGSLTKVTTEQG